LWINNLKTKYQIDINSVQWEKITGSKIITGPDLEVGTSKGNP
jgi:hypothetical protein